MIIGVCTLEFHLPGCHGLKEKRVFMNRLKGRLTARLNVAVAEVEYQDLWQRSVVAVVSVASDRKVVDRTFQRVLREAETSVDGELLRVQTEYL